MSDETGKYKQLEDAGKRAADQQPDEIRLNAAPEHVWSNPAAIEAHATTLQALGFAEAGTYTVDVLPVAIKFLLKDPDRMYAAIYEHPKAGEWLNLIVLYEDGTSITFTNTQDRGLEQRPGHVIVYSPGATAGQLHPIAVGQCPAGARKALSPTTIVAEFERAWVEGTRWRKNRGISAVEVASAIFTGAGTGRVLRKDRIQFLREQDGPPERNLKAAFSKLFEAHPPLQKAYLARVQYDEGPETPVALCLVSDTPRDLHLVETIRKTFKSFFKAGTHLDILLLSAPDVPRLEHVCRPFYTRRDKK